MLEKIKIEDDGSIVIMESTPNTTVFNSKQRTQVIDKEIAEHQKQIDVLNTLKSDIKKIVDLK